MLGRMLETSGLPEIIAVGCKPVGNRTYLPFTALQCDLLSKHHVTQWERADWHKAQPYLSAAFFIDLAHVHRFSSMDPIAFPAIATRHLEVATCGELL